MDPQDAFVAIDPGVEYFAWAYFRGGQLERCGLERGNIRDPWPLDVAFGIVECPERKFDEVREKDVLNLTRAAGELGARFGRRIYVSPGRWKGQVPKDVHHEHHILPKLVPGELAILPKKKGELKHVLDAVGIGLWYLGR